MTLSERAARFRCFGYETLVQFVDETDVAALRAEVSACLDDACPDPDAMLTGSAGNLFRYVPTMSARTPHALTLVKRLSFVAEELLVGPVLPSRAKATIYRGGTRWHRDSELSIESVGFALYLEPLAAKNGALQVLPGSHGATYGAAVADVLRGGAVVPGVAVPTLPGDLIAFDERLFHASAGGSWRRQWRVDFVADRPGTDAALRAYFSGQYSPDWDAGYDVDAHPSHGEAFRALDARWDARLAELGAYAAASAEEAAARRRRGLVPKMAAAGEDQGRSVSLAGGLHVVVADRSTRLDDGADARREG
jgi:hypothetical protein